MKRNELINSKEYWLSKIQLDLYNEVENFMKKNNLKRVELAEKFGVSKGYISQILNGEANHRLSKLVEISLGIGLAPIVSFKSLNEVSKSDTLASILQLKSKTQNMNHLALLRSLQSKGTDVLEELDDELNCKIEDEENCAQKVA